MFPAQLGEAENFTRLWGRESLLLPVALYIDAHNLADAGSHAGQLQALQRFIAHSSGLIFLASREPWSASIRESILLDVQRPTPGEQKSAWGEVLAGESSTNGRTPALLAGHFNLNLPTIHSLARAALSSNQQDIHSQVWRASLARTRPRMEMLAQRIDARATWQDIVLPETEERTLHQIADQVAQRSRIYDEWGFR